VDFGFERDLDLSGIYSLKWHIGPDELPMWVADMDIETAPCIKEALKKRVERGTFGYTIVPTEFNDAVCDWWKTRHGVSFDRDSILFSTSIVPAINSIVRTLTNVGEYIVVTPPVYNMFFNSITDNGRKVLESPLIYSDGKYSIDWKDFEKKLSNPLATLFILCNPHNPTGNIWSKEDLAHIGELCAKHGVAVISDEIHCDITRPGINHTPFASVNETNRRISITCGSPSKAFNTAGLHSAYCIVEDPFLRARIANRLSLDGVGQPNDFSIDATIAAYTQGAEWLDAIRAYLFENKDIAADFIASHCPGMKAVDSDSTYLVWIDCTAYMKKHGIDSSNTLQQLIRKRSGLVLSAGDIYGESGRYFLRLNIACGRGRLDDGLKRLEKAVTE